jgi:hypothetical protein
MTIQPGEEFGLTRFSASVAGASHRHVRAAGTNLMIRVGLCAFLPASRWVLDKVIAAAGAAGLKLHQAGARRRHHGVEERCGPDSTRLIVARGHPRGRSAHVTRSRGDLWMLRIPHRVTSPAAGRAARV